MIEFEALAIKAETDELHIIFLLEKNIQADIIKMILEYLPIAALEMLKKWKVAITSVRQEYESIESQQDYRTSTRTTFRERGASIDIGKFKDNFNKDGKPRCFNCNTYGHIAKECQRPKKERNSSKCYKYDKVGHLARNCRLGWKMKNRSI